jgi:hypothetical protein
VTSAPVTGAISLAIRSAVALLDVKASMTARCCPEPTAASASTAVRGSASIREKPSVADDRYLRDAWERLENVIGVILPDR